MTNRERSVRRCNIRMSSSCSGWMKTTIFALSILALTSGCAVTQRMDINDLSRMKIDCANKDAQIRFLESQMTTSDERVSAALGMNTASELWAHMNGKKTQSRSMLDREYDAAAKMLIWDLRTYCPETQVAGTNVRR
jgi:hypothetical protein